MAKTKTKELKPGYVVPQKEIIMFGLGGMGQGMIYAMMSSYISDYYVNVLQLPLMFVVILMLAARVWDAINDPLMGIIADRRTTKLGKMKGYIVYASPFIAILTLLLYFSPDLEGAVLMIYAALTYVLWGMAYTMADVPFWGIPNVMTKNPEERGQVVSKGKTINGIGTAVPEVLFLVAGIVLPAIISTANPIEFEKKKYFIIACVTTIIGIILYLNSYRHINERYIPPVKARNPGEPSTLKRVFTCKPLLLVIAMGVLSSGRYMIQAAAIHVARYAFYIGDPLPVIPENATPEVVEELTALRAAMISQSVASVKTIFQVCAIVGMFGAMLFMPYLMKKFDYKKLVITTCLAGFVASIFTTVIGWFTSNLYICAPFILISCIPLGVINVISNAMIYDCLDYIELKTGYRDNGLGAACQGFINKIGNAFATTGIIIMYMVIGLEPQQMLSSDVIKAATDLAPSQNFAMFSLVSIIPGVSMLLCAIPMFFYELDNKKKKEIQEELAAVKQIEEN